MNEKKWYKLDSAAIIYASITNKRLPNVFRYSAVLTDEIDGNILQRALDDTVEIYTNFNVNLKQGFFWYYLQETKKQNMVTPENLPICYSLYEDEEDFLYRVSFFKNRINFEICHILSDGRGSIDFFKLLISNYIKIKNNLKINLTTKSSKLEKTEDSFQKYYQRKNFKPDKKMKVYHIKDKKMKNDTLFMECNLDTDRVLELAHKYGTTLTAFLTSVLIYSFKDELSLKDLKKYIRIKVPVDFRTFFNSNSSKNFFGNAHVFYKFKSKDDTLADVVKEVNKQFKNNLKVEQLSKRINNLVAYENNIFCKFIPTALKNIILTGIYSYSLKGSTTCLSNVGEVKFNNRITKYIESVSALTSTSNFQFTICSFKNNLSIGISSKYKYNNIIKNFCRFFPQNDIDLNVQVNEVD